MSSNTNGTGNGLQQLPIFKGINYHFWSLRMTTLFKSQELWDFVKDGFVDSTTGEPTPEIKEKREGFKSPLSHPAGT